MKAIILAGGRGERLKPLTDKIPKPMIEVGGRPILWHIINHLKQYGVSDLIIALCYLPDAITKYFSDGRKFGVRIKYIFEDPKFPLGTSGAILAAKNMINDTFIVTYSDILRELDISKMVKFHKKSKAFATLNIYKRESKGAKSKVVIDSQNQILKFIERPSPQDVEDDYIWVNGSFYILEPEIFKFIPEGRFDFGADIFPKLMASNRALYAYPSAGYLIDIGDIKKLSLARRFFNMV